MSGERDDSQFSGTVQHSRLIAKIGDFQLGASTKGRTVPEMDFFKLTDTGDTNFNNIQLRVRQLYAEIVGASWSVLVGQAWDLFSPLDVATLNTNGNFWFGGNAGFRRSQLRVIMDFKPSTGHKVSLVSFFVGTSTGAKAAPMAETNKIPLVGSFTGAGLLRNPVKKWVVNVRASYYDETRAMVDNLVALGRDKIAVFYQKDAFGKAVLEGVKIALEKHGKKPVALGTNKRNTMDIAQGLAAIKPANPDAIVMVGTYAPLAKFVKQSKTVG